MARHIIESRDIQYGEREKLSSRIYNSSNGYIPKNIEEYGIVIINLNYNHSDKLYIDNYALNTKWILKVANNDDHSNNILKNVWFFVHGNNNYPDVLDYTEDIIYKGCELEASKLILNYITNTYLLSINLLDNNILKNFLSNKNYSLHFQKISTYNNELNNLEFVPNKNNIIKDVCDMYNLTYKELGNIIGLSESRLITGVSTNKVSKQTEASINMFKKNKELEKELEKNNLLKQLLKEWLN